MVFEHHLQLRCNLWVVTVSHPSGSILFIHGFYWDVARLVTSEVTLWQLWMMTVLPLLRTLLTPRSRNVSRRKTPCLWLTTTTSPQARAGQGLGLYLTIVTSVSSDYQHPATGLPHAGVDILTQTQHKTLQILVFCWEYSPMRQVRAGAHSTEFPSVTVQTVASWEPRTRKTPGATINMRVSPGAGLQLAFLMVRRSSEFYHFNSGFLSLATVTSLAEWSLTWDLLISPHIDIDIDM